MKFLVSLLVLLGVTIVFVITELPDKHLHVISCDVGQGDATMLVYQDFQILVDGGSPEGGVEKCLSRHMPFWDREIEVVIMTHPQLDHFGGLIDVFGTYKVRNFVTSEIGASTPEYRALENAVGVSGARIINAATNPEVGYGLIHLDIVHPTERFVRANTDPDSGKSKDTLLEKRTTSRDPNDFSVVAMVSLGEFDALLTGDIGPAVIDEILSDGNIEDMDYIKTPHHGSKNGLTKSLLDITKPELATISSGKDNTFGHPHQEVLELLDEYQVQYFRTDLEGDIEIVTDGKRYWREK